ncbi:MAG: DUF2934 domain-containing protein [Nitrospinota bacterium]|nr:DUF2934 domain-containing protein [Nitrospinota bacterium]
MGTDKDVAKIAYELWLKNGCIHGKDCEHWLEAEKIAGQGQAVVKKAKPKSPPKKPKTKKKTP